MEFQLLGPLEVRAGDESLPLGRPKQRALLALLLLNANRVVARDRLIDELWGERTPETAVKALQVYVSQLRKLLPAGMLVTQPPGYVLRVEPEAVDLLRFERLVADARNVGGVRAAGLLREALDLWRGQPLAEFAEEPFVRAESRRLADVRLTALEERIDADLALGRHAEVTPELEALVVEHSQRERLWGQLMLALYQGGRQADALQAYRHARAALGELGLEPGAALRQRERQILVHDDALNPPRELPVTAAPRLPGPLAPTPPFPFVGREREQATLQSLLHRAEQGEGSFVLLAGEAGGGKTRLLRELSAYAVARGTLVCYGASDATVSTPYQALREWLEFLLRACDADALNACLPQGGEMLARLVPELGRVTGRPALEVSEPASDAYQLQAAAVELFRRLSDVQPLLLVADDVHWSTPESLDLLRRLARMAPEARLVAVATYRDPGEDVGEAIIELSRLDSVTKLSLGNLSREEVSSFIRASTGAEAGRELADAVAELSDGTPLLLCELWRELDQRGALDVSASEVRLASPLAELQGVERLQDLVLQRLSRLAPETRAALTMAAVAGPQFELRLLAEAESLDQGALVAIVEEAARSGVIEELPDWPPTSRFTHELVRRAVYDRIKRIRRAELHLRVAEALERLYAAEPEHVLHELAHHFTMAAPLAGIERAVRYNLEAAAASIASAAYPEAAARYSTALELGIADGHERARVQIELAFLLNETGRISESVAMTATALEAATNLEERGLAMHAALRRVGHLIFADPQYDPRECRPIAEAAIETFERLGDRRGLGLAERMLGLSLWRQGAAGGPAALERALAHAEAAHDPAVYRVVATTYGGMVCEGPMPVAEGLALFGELLGANEHDRVVQGVITRFRSLLLAMAGRFDEANDGLLRSSAFLDELNLLTPSWVYRRVAGAAKELMGDLAGAEDDLIARLESFRDLRDGGPDGRAIEAVAWLAHLYCDQGRWQAADDLLGYSRQVPPLAFFRAEAVLCSAAEARLAAHNGNGAKAVERAQRAVDVVAPTDLKHMHARLWLALAEVQRHAGNTKGADQAVLRALELYEAKGNVAAATLLRGKRGVALPDAAR